MPKLLNLVLLQGCARRANKEIFKKKVVVKNDKKIGRKNKLRQDISFIKDTMKEYLAFSKHGEERMLLRYEGDKEKVIEKLAKKYKTTSLDSTTGNIKINFEGRWVISKEGYIVTYLTPLSQTKRATIKNHKAIHKYKPMGIPEIKQFRENVLLVRKPVC